MSAENVIDSARDVQRVAERMLNATNNGVLSFTTDNKKYILEPYSFTVEKFSLMCGPGQELIQENFRCGKNHVFPFLSLPLRILSFHFLLEFLYCFYCYDILNYVTYFTILISFHLYLSRMSPWILQRT